MTPETRFETRIGLLIGLMFIVFFGLVLSEVAGSRNDKGKAPILPGQAVAKNVPPGPDTPIIDDPTPVVARRPESPAARYESVAVATPPPVAPPRESVNVKVLPPENETGPVIASGTLILPDVRRETPPAPPVRAADVAAAPPAGHAIPATPAVASAAPAGTKYVVQPKDTLIKIAEKIYGKDKSREYKRIAEANKSVLGSKGTLLVGVELTIPPLPPSATVAAAPAGAAAPAVATASGTTPAPAAPAAVASAASPRRTPTTAPASGVVTMTVDELSRTFTLAPSPSSPAGTTLAARGRGVMPSSSDTSTSSGSPAAPGTGAPVSAVAGGMPAVAVPGTLTVSGGKKTYVIKAGDSLAKIARTVMKDDSKAAVQRLYKANKDRLSNPNSLLIGTELTIPS